MQLRIAVLLFAIMFISLGLAWHLPLFYSNELLFGMLQVDASHNKIYIASGLLALVASSSTLLSQFYLKIIGLLYAFVGLAGLLFSEEFLAMKINRADNLLHLMIGLLAVWLGFKLLAIKK